MKISVDLHVHSALSPCADDEMTPNNIINMALLKGLDAIAVTDHNSAKNIKAIFKCAKKAGILLVPGMEVETREEVHLVCLFPDCDSAIKMQTTVYNALPDIKNREDIFGKQLVMDENDDVVQNENRMLLTAANIGVDEVYKTVYQIGGVVIPAHVDRDSYSIVSNLGLIPDYLNIHWVEVSKSCDTNNLRQVIPSIKNKKIIKSSDAHHLGDILERENFVKVGELNIKSILDTFR